MSRLPISDYGLLSDCRTCCARQPRRIDRLAVLPALRQHVAVRPAPRRPRWSLVDPSADGDVEASRRYLETRWCWRRRSRPPTRLRQRSPTRWLVGRHRSRATISAPGGPHSCCADVVGVDRVDRARDDYAPRPEYGLVSPPAPPRRWRGDGPRRGRRAGVVARQAEFEIDGSPPAPVHARSGDTMSFAMHHRAHVARSRPRSGRRRRSKPESTTPPKPGAPGRSMHQSYDGPWADLVRLSGRVLYGLTYFPTGAIVAAPTTSLPETPGGSRNWDYRYTWVRDASFTLQALWVAACPHEAGKFFDYLADTATAQVSQRRRPPDHVRHRRRARSHRTRARGIYSGWRNSKPGAHRQRGLEPAPARRLRRAARTPRTGCPTN